MTYDIFISYKRLGASSATAAYLYEILQQKGYNVFFDRKEMRSGKFNEQLLEHIQNATDVIILLEKDSLRSWFDHRVAPKSKSFDDDSNGDAPARVDAAEDFQEEPYKTDWFCQEIMHALGIPGKNIIPILLEGYLMPAGKDLPPEMKELSNYQALTLDISETSEFYEKYLVGPKPYLKSKPTNLSLSRRVQSKGGIVGRFLFYTEVKSCDLFECGDLVATLTDDQDEWHPFCYPVDFAGEHRFRVVNNDSCEVLSIASSVETYCQQYVHVQFSDTRDLWELTPEEIDAQEDVDLLTRWGKGLFAGTSQHKPDITLSFACLQRAIQLGSQEALSFVGSYGAGLIDQKQAPVEVAVKWYRIAAEQGNVDAQINMGNAYSRGQGVEQDDAKAMAWYLKAAEQGAPRAQWFLGNRYRSGQSVEQDLGKALEWYGKAAEQGYAPAQRNLGHMYRDGQGVERDYGKAFEWYVKAAEQGDVYAQINMGGMYRDGRGVGQDYAKACEWYAKAAEQGYAPAQRNLGNMYLDGHGVEQNYGKAREWYTKAAEQGYAPAQRNLGHLYRDGRGVKQNYEKAFEWYGKASEAGDVYAQINLGHLYRYGRGVEQDYGKACEWYGKAAEKDYPAAMYHLGCMYEQGLGVEQDFEKALEWYFKAEEKGEKRSYNVIAWTYHLMGDYEKALPWAEKALAAYPDSPYVIDTVATVYEGLGRYDEALEQFEQCLRLFEEMGDEERMQKEADKIEALKEKMNR